MSLFLASIIPLLLGAIVLVIWFFTRPQKTTLDEDEFQKVFDFYPSKKPSKEGQEKVSMVLRILATDLSTACNNELEHLYKNEKELDSKISNGLKESVQLRKSKYWRASELAQKRGFAVPRKFTDLLTAE